MHNIVAIHTFKFGRKYFYSDHQSLIIYTKIYEISIRTLLLSISYCSLVTFFWYVYYMLFCFTLRFFYIFFFFCNDRIYICFHLLCWCWNKHKLSDWHSCILHEIFKCLQECCSTEFVKCCSYILLLSCFLLFFLLRNLIFVQRKPLKQYETSTTPSCGGPLRAQIFQNLYNQKWPLGPLLPFLKRAPELIKNGNFQK